MPTNRTPYGFCPVPQLRLRAGAKGRVSPLRSCIRRAQKLHGAKLHGAKLLNPVCCTRACTAAAVEQETAATTWRVVQYGLVQYGVVGVQSSKDFRRCETGGRICSETAMGRGGTSLRPAADSPCGARHVNLVERVQCLLSHKPASS